MTALIVFGDSLCDGGNAHALRGDAAFPCPPHWRGRRCDGPVWVEQLAQRLGLPPLVHALAGGSNHAYGGARSGTGLSPKGLPNLLEQVAGFLGEGGVGGADPRLAAGPDGPVPWFGLAGGGSGPGASPVSAAASDGSPSAVSGRSLESGAAVGGLAPSLFSGNSVAWDPDALVVLRAGANDYLDAPPSPAIGDAVNRNLLTAVERLAAAGLRHFLVPSELPWGFSPIQLPGLGEAERRGLNALIARQNATLQEALQDLAVQRGLVVVQPDFHALLLAVLADPAVFGFTEIERPVLVLDGAPGGAPVDPAVTTSAGQPPGASAAPTPDLPAPVAEPARSAAAVLPSPGDASTPPSGDPGLAARGATPDAAGHLWWDSWAHLTTTFHGRMAERAFEKLGASG